MKKKFIVGGLVLILALCVVAFAFRVKIRDAVFFALRPELPQEKSAQDFIEVPVTAQPEITKTATAPSVETETPKSTESKVASASANLSIPFATQAPSGNWGMPYQEACEEASIIMVHKYFANEALTPEIMDQEIQDLVEWEVKTFGYYADTNAAEIARTLKEYFGHKDVVVMYEFTLDDIKDALLKGYPVIMPLAGRELQNPYFTAPGPIYHALVVKGFVKDKLITNDPGTKRGRDYLYDPQVLLDASHEWSTPDITKGRPAIIIVKS